MNGMKVALVAAQLAVLATSLTAQEQQAPTGSLSGQVVNSLTGEAVGGARVTLLCTGQNSSYREAATDRGGMFAATGLAAGSCTIFANHRDYAGIMGMGQPAASAEVGAGQETTGVQVKLMPGGAISGRVVNDDGEPLQGCFVQVYSPQHLGHGSRLQPRNGAMTDDQGEFHLAHLSADRYVLHAQCPESLPVERLLGPYDSRHEEPRESWLPVFYPNSTTVAGATMLSVAPGAELQNIEFKLRTTPVVTVRGSVTGAAGPGVNVQLIPDAATGDPSAAVSGGYDQKEGTFRIDFVPPGSYRLQVVSRSGQPDSLAMAEQRITTGTSDPEPVIVQLQAAIALQGVVQDPPGTDAGSRTSGDQLAVVAPPIRLGGGFQPQPGQAPAKGWVQFIPETANAFGAGMFRQGEVHQDGSFEVNGLAAGRYRVRYQPALMQSYVDWMQYGATRIEGDEIEIGAAAAGMLKIVLAAKGARVQIHLAGDSSSGTTSWSVVLAPAGRSFLPGAGMPMLQGLSGADLTYDNLAPGKYFVFGVQQTPANLGYNERVFELLQPRLEPVDIGAGTTTSITPKLFTSDDITRLALTYLQGENQ